MEPSKETAALKTLGISDDEDEEGILANQASGVDEKMMKAKCMAIYKKVMDKEADKAHEEEAKKQQQSNKDKEFIKNLTKKTPKDFVIETVRDAVQEITKKK